MLNKKVLVIAAHADDEVLGCGGTIAKHSAEGDRVHLLVIADGVSARFEKPNGPEFTSKLTARETSAQEAGDILGVESIRFLRFPDNRCDDVAILDIIRAIEGVCNEFLPDTIYTHHANDLNVDHRVVHQAVLTACRPLAGCTVKQIYGFEVLSSTEWELSHFGGTFKPSRYVDVSGYMDHKLRAMTAYAMEMSEFPHPRSSEVIIAKSVVRGAEAGLCAAEAFVVIREIV